MIIDQIPGQVDGELRQTLDTVASVCAQVAQRIRRGGIDENLGAARGTNTDGDSQKALDVIADESFASALRGGPVRYYASEEVEDVVELNPAGSLALVIDPLDGSSNIDTNVSVGTIFGIYQAKDEPVGSVLRPGRELLTAGYAIYGPQCVLVLSVGDGTLKYVLDPDTGVFRLVGPMGPIPEESTEYAINASNYRHWPAPIRAYIDDRVAGAEGPLGHDFNMRWIASLVAETHRILTRGGIFLYPSDARKGYERGRLRMVYECAPIAFLIEQAGGRATDGLDPILDATADALHARTPFVFGSANKVGRVATYFDLPEEETSALFGKRGLFRG
ncbi:fructose 1,6-bisphosphatase [Ruegeria marisrubri]|uniref:Fructose-1,6-bisphosphatase class 1 n=1 Tax=Ruegeria marisrubri TaxID=1685379 RepID=A0A0X3UEX6_9RHOB|nr:class 1 fructose-bisphosphatase [Ruegeria marisrubri]KUJ85476.1 fructose 1,6-bisphosphatase [Ruegeria marisrubri]